ncbi:unnamed protein product [Coffea canephora]|uniref:Uncharacterized protein n=1 Tax=Coffea canephora TaxID=49390 RepID=A0A068U5N4_COFCA|nr:unnamed protein product [Coffea canephora]
MGWSYPDISLEDLMRVIKGFVDMLVLASGYQSSGRLSHWDSHNIEKAFQWATFLEIVLRSLRSSDDNQDSVAELDAALSQLTSNPCFPEGLRQLSCTTLSHARDLMVKHLVRSVPLTDAHLRASVAAVIGIDSHQFQSIGTDELHLYLERLMTNALKDFILTGSNAFSSFTKSAVQGLGRRQLEVSCISAAETGLDALSNMITKSNMIHDHGTTTEERPVEPAVWSQWKLRSLSYLLNKRTIRLVSGAALLFSAPKQQWIQELLLLGSIAHKWSSLVEKFMSSSYECLTIFKLFQEVQNFLSGRLQNLCCEENILTEEQGALEYLEGLLGNQFHHFWKMSPVLLAMAIPSRSMLFRLYLIELEHQMRGDSSAIRCCSCMMDGKNHGECEIAERIWCLYIFQASGTW